MFKALPWTAGTALIRLHALSSWTGWLVHAGLLPKASLSDHPPPRCDDDCYDSADKGQSKMSQAMGWTDGGYTGFGGMKEERKMNWKLLPHTIFQRKTTWRLQKKKRRKHRWRFFFWCLCVLHQVCGLQLLISFGLREHQEFERKTLGQNTQREHINRAHM